MDGALWRLAERFASSNGERKTRLTRQIAFEPLPSSVSLGVRLDSVEMRKKSLETEEVCADVRVIGDKKLVLAERIEEVARLR